jgi:hypothetical protein
MKIYISSTYEDLKDHREAVHNLLCKITGREIHAMEHYIACDERPVDRCTSDAADSDVYVGIFAWRYGYIPGEDNPEEHSITCMEYLAAKAASKPCLIFLARMDGWPLELTDAFGTGMERINGLRAQLEKDHVVSHFTSPDELAGLVSAAVTDWEKRGAREEAEPEAGPVEPPQFRELGNSVLIAYAAADEGLARELASACAPASAKPVLISPTALFAEGEAALCRLEADAIRCDAGLVLLTPATVALLAEHPERTRRVLTLLAARFGPASLRGVLAEGLGQDDLPPEWGLTSLIALPAAGLDGVDLSPLGGWLAGVLPPWGVSAVGLPVSVVAMRDDEARALMARPDMVGAELGTRVQQQYEAAVADLQRSGIDWVHRYAPARMHWQPFGAGEGSVREIVEAVVEDINRRDLPKLRDRHIKAQWYPFDVVMEQCHQGEQDLRTVYEGVARAGCVLVVDELSLFHPGVRQALTYSPMFNNDQVALVAVSPVDPDDVPLNQTLESEARHKLAGAFTRFAMDYDPQCELAVGNQRRLRRWLHASLPETVIHLREPRPDARAMNDFFDSGGVPARAAIGGYPWGGGEEP